jgi:hypothetical protein
MDDALKMILGVTGSILLVVGCFLPLLSGPRIIESEIVNSSAELTILFIGLGLFCLIMVFLRHYGISAIFGGLSLVALLVIYMASVSLQRYGGSYTYGIAWAALMLGGVFLVIPGILSLKELQEQQPSET